MVSKGLIRCKFKAPEGPKRATRGGWMGANKNSSIELGLYPKYHLESSLLARSSICSHGWATILRNQARKLSQQQRKQLKHRMQKFCSVGWSGQYTGWSDDHLKVSPDRLVRSMCFSDYLEDHAPDDPMVSWKNTTGWSDQARKAQQGDYLKVLCIGWSGGYLRKPQEDPVVNWEKHRKIRWSLEKQQEYPMVLDSWT